MKAVWKGTTLAKSDATIVVEGNHYFPPQSVDQRYLSASDHTTFCPWKGTARYYDVEVAGERNANAAWYYPEAKPEAANIEGYVAFWKGVEVGD